VTYNRNKDGRGGQKQPSETLGPSAFMQQLVLKRRLRRLTCPTEMAPPASRCVQVQPRPSVTAESGKRRPPIEWRGKYSRRDKSQKATVK
jgi:hypothetical protein